MTKLEIILEDNGRITLNGPLNNKIFCYGLLVAAEEVIRSFQPSEQKLIEVPEFQAPSNVRGPRLVDDGR